MVATKAPELKWNILSVAWNRGLKFRLFEVRSYYFILPLMTNTSHIGRGCIGRHYSYSG